METQLQKSLSRTESVAQWFDERLGIAAIAKLAKKKEVPIHRHGVWYYFGGMTLFLIGVQVITGTLLLLYYRPSAEGAFESVQFIMTDVQFGWLIRSVHSWSANLLIATLFIHLFSVYFLKAYRPPRELTWVTGAFLLFIMLGFGFSGYLLPWNKLAFFATKVGTDIAGVVPVVGHFMLRFLRGGDDVTGATLTRFYGFHIAVLPGLTLALLGIHALLVQKHGMSIPPSLADKPVKTMKFVPNFLLRDLIGWILAIGVLAALAAIFPWELGEKADAFASAPKGIRPEWYFLFMFQTLKLIPAKIWIFEGEVIGILAFAIGGLLMVLVPFLDRPSPQGKSNPLWNIAGVVILIYIIAMTVYGYLD